MSGSDSRRITASTAEETAGTDPLVPIRLHRLICKILARTILASRGLLGTEETLRELGVCFDVLAPRARSSALIEPASSPASARKNLEAATASEEGVSTGVAAAEEASCAAEGDAVPVPALLIVEPLF